MQTTYNNTPVKGYRDGLIISDTRPDRVITHYDDNRGDVSNDWFTIDDRRYNVHPYRADLGGYPVRWSEAL